MNYQEQIQELSQDEMILESGGGPLLRLLCLYVIINRETIWENTVVAYFDGFRDEYNKVVNDSN